MTEYTFLIEIAILFVAASLFGLIFNYFKQPAIFAYIITGVVVGPGLLGLIDDKALIHDLSEVGVIALLFTLGLEFSFDKFKEIRNQIITAGILQIMLTIIVTSIIVLIFGFDIAECFVIGCIVALSSTVVVLKSLSDSAQMDSIHGRIILGILIIQDLSLIPIMIILSNLNSESGSILIPLSLALLKAGIFLMFALIISLKVMPGLMNYVTNSNKEHLILSSVAIAIGTATLGTYFGLSPALGAFVAGLALSITIHNKQVIAEIVPFRDVFAMVFFVSIGLIMDINYFINNFGLIIVVVAGIMTIKFFIVFAVVFANKYPGQTALWAGLSLLQIGEFSFIIAKLGKSENFIDDSIYSLIIISTLVTMILTPFIVKLTPLIIIKLQKVELWNHYFKGIIDFEEESCQFENHIIICGYGPIGRSIAKILTLANEKFFVIELNNSSIQELRENNIPSLYGDATHSEILSHSNVHKAKIITISLPDYRSCELATANARSLNKDIFIIVRARFRSHIETLYNAGANIVVYEEHETSLGFIANALSQLNYDKKEVETITKLIHSNSYELLKESCIKQNRCRTLMTSGGSTEIDWIKISKESPLLNKTIAESDIRHRTGASIITLVKENKDITNPSPDLTLDEGNIIAILGTREQLNKLKEII